ncbi:putative MFS family arabinose efflux permease [Rhizobium aquaticum]|uniref:MFS family arabinose efflux permease n=1 Tax=Rhizobium aquaticum TaxID=1549636 RepID=A0ABV2ITD9_9HYPH
MTGPETIFGLKVATLISSGLAAVITVILDWRSHDWLTAVGSIIAGVFVATVATDLTLDVLGVSENPGSWGYAIAATYGIAGRNLILWIKTASSNPPRLVRDLLGLGKGNAKDGE